ncbi:S-adenosyl-L-methionine-dependentmethyltransferases superfamily protein [Striga asiatica]|uniref:S-adenosyl-L-methionine-dependentmethyltransferases superfamily protein n=1 Tax=Striga asiatica TaxID=4170 RepID=A0A5A7P3Q7_STRAF|nr:S-adenosyl-L-methionine-dependentmethyltransferases superfamily protein [Striga asiatica]
MKKYQIAASEMLFNAGCHDLDFDDRTLGGDKPVDMAKNKSVGRPEELYPRDPKRGGSVLSAGGGGGRVDGGGGEEEGDVVAGVGLHDVGGGGWAVEPLDFGGVWVLDDYACVGLYSHAHAPPPF